MPIMIVVVVVMIATKVGWLSSKLSCGCEFSMLYGAYYQGIKLFRKCDSSEFALHRAPLRHHD